MSTVPPLNWADIVVTFLSDVFPPIFQFCSISVKPSQVCVDFIIFICIVGACCNDKAGQDDFFITLNIKRETKRTQWSLSLDCSTYLYTISISICLCVCLSNFLQPFQNVPSYDLSCNPYLILSYFSFYF